MILTKRNPNVLFPTIMDELFKQDWSKNFQAKLNVPAVNIMEKENNFEIQLEVPGRNKEDFNLELENQVLTISSKIESEETTTNDKFTRKEFTKSSFKRAFTLPDSIIEEDLKANYENGILKIELPKKEEALPKPKKLIEVA